MGEFFIFLFIAFLYLPIIALSVAMYILQSLGLMSMLRSVGYKKPWFAWVPILNARACGDLADFYDNGKPSRNLGKKLMTLTIVITALSVGFGFIYLFAVIAALGGGYGSIYSIFASLFFLLVLYYCAWIAIAVIYTIYYYKAVWSILRIFAPSASVGLLMLCIFVTEAFPFVIFALRNKEPQNLRRAEGDYEDKNELPPENPYTYS